MQVCKKTCFNSISWTNGCILMLLTNMIDNNNMLNKIFCDLAFLAGVFVGSCAACNIDSLLAGLPKWRCHFKVCVPSACYLAASWQPESGYLDNKQWSIGTFFTCNNHTKLKFWSKHSHYKRVFWQICVTVCRINCINFG